MKKILSSLILVVFGLVLFAQTDEELLRQLVEEDRSSVEALVLYPENTRLAILEAAVYPEALIRLEGMQQQTSSSFKTLLEPYPMEIQQMVWDLTRYPGLIERLVTEGDRSASRIRIILEDYPEAIHERALKAGVEYFLLLGKINELDHTSRVAFESFIRTYPPRTQDALRHLLDLPEVLSILTDNIRLTVLLGDIYKRDPQWVLQKVDSLSLEVARQQARDLEDWKQSIAEDPKAAEELKESAQVFAREYGYEDEYYAQEYDYDDAYYDYENPEVVVVERNYHYYYNYPYWFGYPYWYVYPRWRPYPVWHEWGFYYRPGRNIVIIGFPSYYFTNWYFYHPSRWYYYPHLSSRFVGYYYGPRRSTGSIVVSVDNWKRRNPLVTDEWLAPQPTRVERIRQIGRLETDRAEFNRRNPDRPLAQPEYLERNTRKYPEIERAQAVRQREVAPTEPSRRDETRPAREETKVQPPARDDSRREPAKVEPPKTEPRREVPKAEPPKTEPRREVPKTEPPRTEPRRETPKVEPPKTEPKREVPRTEPPKTEPRKEQPAQRGREIDYRQIEKGKELHRQTWERNKPQPKVEQPARKVEQPRTRTEQPARKTEQPGTKKSNRNNN
jgi:hypothetical protein